jgi:hypothetical protein
MKHKPGLFAPILDRLPRRLQWTAHNLVAHPAGEIIYVLTGHTRFGNWLHDATLPSDYGDAPVDWGG